MGVLLYADDKIFQSETPENTLFNLLVKEVPLVGVQSIEETQDVVNSVSSFDAIILDWDFKPDKVAVVAVDGSGDVQVPERDETLDFLMDNSFYSLVYIFSENEIERSAKGGRLKEKYGKRIQFVLKQDFAGDETKYKEKILQDITQWQTDNAGLSLPIKWSQSINNGTQAVFGDLSDANPDWIRTIYENVANDGMDPEVFVIDLLQMILAEQLTSNFDLIKLIKESCQTEVTKDELSPENELKLNESLSKIYSRLFYTNLHERSPIMTGDICELSRGAYGIIISPECDMNDILSDDHCFFDLLVFNPELFDEYIQNGQQGYTRSKYTKKNASKKSSLRKKFNQEEIRTYFLPSLPIDENNKRAVIDFKTGSVKLRSKAVKKCKRPFKLNSPFIQQLRQKFLSYFGRVGVPAIPIGARDWNLGINRIILEADAPDGDTTSPQA